MSKLGKSVPVQFRKEGVWTPQLGMFLLWFQFLQLSPSYELARRRQSGLFNDVDRTLRPADFNQVLAVYDDLGDALHPSFTEWWQDRGIENFGYHGDKPTVRQIAATSDAKDADLADDKNALKILTSRAISRGRMIAENAARGVFPSYAPCTHPVKFSDERMRDLIMRREHYQQMHSSA